ncbi:asparagine synthase (glutamine-hydrolyzing) [Bifidobacterium parmae]|uniref:asparagine synthase (glutamine-hydrolyzing) n=1 Tax=Bifidobacterium parmae TaxID=361854 RepID=A0A2N5J2Z9_9BIFI|nr:asparagine synthase (glutamine-hydrolyzing) [Bifidobacterium parmae]PLS28605.1 asparagine synthetase B [Bifidobacterium parmae]
MCGIAGFVNDDPIDVKCPVIKRMTDIIAHRGPDSEGKYVDGHVALGHRRLSIIDLGGGQQPIYNEDGNLVITFNGEIYNYQPLRAQLIEAGHTFTTESDTEVLLHGYEEWGVELLQKIRGMFTFVIWDKTKKELFGARDHFGIKPFYYAKMNGTFMYASEIKSLLQHPDFVKELNREALKPYMTFQYPPFAETFFKGVFKLPEGHYFTYRDGKMDIHRYYDERFRESDVTLDHLVDTIDDTVMGSVKAHQIADVEVGSFLSSGVDSSYVAAVARPQHTYSIGFGKGTYNESQQAGELAEILKLNNTAEALTDEEAFSAFPQIQWHLDEPDSNPSCVPLFFLSKLAAHDVKVVLSGEGADELFGGYIDYGVHTKSKAIKVVTRWLTHLPAGARHAIARWCKGKTFHGAWHLYANLAPAEESFIGQARVFEESESDRILKPAYRKAPSVQSIVDRTYARIEGKGLSELKKKQYLDMHQWMPGDILLKADKLTMAHSLELRVPLLDKVLMGVAEQVPTKWLINDENTKYAFRQAAGRHLPEEWKSREKLGFPVPIKKWLREEKYYKLVRSVFERDYVNEFFDQDALLKMLDDNYAGRTDDRRRIWTVYTFLTWYDVYFVHDGSKPAVLDLGD